MHSLYTLLWYLATPLVLLRLAWRARHQPGYLRHVPERFGFYRAGAAAPLIWIHAVSVGETRAAAPLIGALKARFPDHRILLTHMTPSGRDTGRSLFGDRVIQAYLPYDWPGAVQRFLRHFRPRLGLVMETELWPNLLTASRRAGVPVALVNARLSQRSARGYARIAPLARACLQALALVAAQSAADARRLRALGAREVIVTGNLKFDILPPEDLLARGRAWRAHWGNRPVLLAASTREGEEALLLDAMRDAPPEWLWVIVPRHPQRFEAVAQLLAARGLAFRRRSHDDTVDAGTRVLLGDSMGELFAYYAAADVAIVGGSLLPYGGQNPIEACAVGVPAIVGPHTYNFAQVTRAAIAAGAVVQVKDATRAVTEASRLLKDAAQRARMGAAGREFSAENRGATDKTVAALARLLEKP